MEWHDDVALRVIEEVLSANSQRWPETKQEWERLAHRFGVRICYQAGLPPARATIQDNVVFVPPPGKDSSISDSVYTHELAEAALLWEGTEPYVFPAELSCREMRHAISRLVEKNVREIDPTASVYVIEGETMPFPGDDEAPPLQEYSAQPTQIAPTTLASARQAYYAAQDNLARAEAQARAWAEAAERIKKDWRLPG